MREYFHLVEPDSIVQILPYDQSSYDLILYDLLIIRIFLYALSLYDLISNDPFHYKIFCVFRPLKSKSGGDDEEFCLPSQEFLSC